MTEPETNQPDVIGFLYVLEGNLSGEIIKLFSERNVIGTSAECTVVLNDSGISAKHASIRYEDEKYIIRDLDSKNGTYVNGEDVVKHELQENDVLLLGDTKLKLKML
jgi:pSer/pThr/pTyr-binding forkhead associated (FHA) protein